MKRPRLDNLDLLVIAICAGGAALIALILAFA
jgi:hypothetical protein